MSYSDLKADLLSDVCCFLHPLNGENKTKRNESECVSGQFKHDSPMGREERGQGPGPKQALGRHRG